MRHQPKLTDTDGHIHAPQYPNLGLFAGTLLDWLKAYTFPMESSLGNASSPMYANSTTTPDPFARAQAVYAHVIDKTLSYGTTSAAYYATVDVPATNLLASLALQKGQRAYIGRTCMDNQEYNPEYYRDESPEDALNKTLATIKHIQEIDPSGELVAPIVTPRFAPAVTNQSMTMLAELANNMSLRIQVHMDENVGEVKLVAEMYPESSSYAGVYDDHGLLTNRTILGHGIHMTDAEIALVAARGAGVAHCPASNSALGSGICHVRKLIDAGVTVGLGTDAAGGYSASVLEAGRQAFLVSRLLSFQEGQNASLSVPVTEVLYLGTMGGAKLTGMEGRLGGFVPGMLWDVQEIQLDNWETKPVDIFGWENWHDRVNKWVWNGDDRNVNRVWVGGRLVHQR
jgi:guanine deaminase